MAVAPSKAKTGYGAEFALASSAILASAGGDGVDWAEVTALTPPSDTADTAEVTHFLSPNMTREWIKTLIDGGEADIEVNLVPGGATDVAMQVAMNSPDAFFYAMKLPKTATSKWKISGTCLVTSYSRGVTIGEAMKATARLRFTGTRTEAALP